MHSLANYEIQENKYWTKIMHSQLLFPTISELSYEILIIIQLKAQIKNWTIKKRKQKKQKTSRHTIGVAIQCVLEINKLTNQRLEITE